MRSSSRRPFVATLVCLVAATSVVIVVAACGEDATTIPTSTVEGGTDPTGTGTGTSGGPGTDEDAGDDGGLNHGGNPDAGRDAGHDAGKVKDSGSPNEAGCPESPDGPSPGHCSLGETCNYPNGSCACLGFCGGIVLPDDPSHWACVVRDPMCPAAKPKNDDPCTAPAGTMCEYPECCTTTFSCKAGVWASKPAICPK